MLKSKSNRKQRRNPNTLNTERLEQRAMFSVSPVEPVVALDVGPVNQTDDNGCSIVHPEFRTGSQAGPRGTSFMSGDDVRMIVHPEFRGGGDGIRIVHPEFRGGGDGIRIVHPEFRGGSDGIRIVHPEFRGGDDSIRIVHPEFDGDATSVGETLVGRESERPQPLDLPSREMLDAQLNDGLHNMHQIDTTLMDQAITEAMMQDVYMDMVLGSMVYQEGGEVGIPAEQPNQSINIGSALFSRKEQRHNSTSDVQDGTAPPVDLDGDGDCEDYEGVDHCPQRRRGKRK